MVRISNMIAVLCLFALALSGCGDNGLINKAVIAAAKSAVRSRLADPETAEFGQVWVSHQEWGPALVCGYVSARDRLSGQSTGYQRFVYAGSAEDTHLEEEFDDRLRFEATWDEFC